ncbi:MAG: ferrous iron transport protein B [Oscillospiraceae bacterium]|jgi:ferrous iron transport protein B|nr:ferrous iron transport protein B [Oscillospiraceae bacterium]
MEIKIALAGNPNSGKTTMFNDLTGSSQYVGNWPGVTVEKKEGRLKGQKDIIIQDLPGIYSLSPYTLEEVVARKYLVGEKPDAIIAIVDGTNIERNLYLATQLIELGIPTVVAVNMMDLVRRSGDVIDFEKLGKALGCDVIETSALKGEGSIAAAQLAAELGAQRKIKEIPPLFNGSVEHAIAHIEEIIDGLVEERFLRWYAIKVFERDKEVIAELKLTPSILEHLEKHITECEREQDDDAESIITNQRYEYITKIVSRAVKKKKSGLKNNASDKIDRVVTNRFLALPIFAAVMFLVYYISMGAVGGAVTDWTNEVLFGEVIITNLSSAFTALGVAPWLTGLTVDGIIAGVGAVIGFVPQMFILFLLLSILEDVGYMSRIAFIMDRLFRRFGLSGKSFIPLLIGSGCSVPGIMASRTIESVRDRRMTVMTTSFIPCGAKLPIISMLAGAIFGNSPWVAVSAYFVGIGSVVVSGIILKKTKPFAGEASPFVMELPHYHIPAAESVLRATWERGWSFVKRAGTVILASSVILWFLQAFGIENGALTMVTDNNSSLLSSLGGFIAPVFSPLGFGDWKAAVATLTGLLAKENVVGTFGVLYGAASAAESGGNLWSALAADFTGLTAYSFMLFNLLCAPCFAAMGAIRQEMKSAAWTWGAIGYMTVYAYCICLMVYQFGLLLSTGQLSAATFIALAVAIVFIYMLTRRNNNLRATKSAD